MRRGEPVVIVNGIVFGYGSGEETKQAFSDIGLQFDSSIRAAKGTRAVIYALDARTGDELWSSGDQMHEWNHFSGITVANGRVYLGTYDGTLYSFAVAAPAGRTP
jgi:outer membrane protein assembly factor BamB